MKYRNILWSLIIAQILFSFVFLTEFFDFWVRMSLSMMTLLVISLCVDSTILIKIKPESLKDVTAGCFTALFLYGVFLVGFHLLKWAVEPGAVDVYVLKESRPLVLVGLLLVFPISFSEEIYWRGLIQSRFMDEFDSKTSWIIVSIIYGAVHLITGNVPLVIAALIVGFFWGWLYMKTRSLSLVIVSHAVWNEIIFVLFPLS